MIEGSKSLQGAYTNGLLTVDIADPFLSHEVCSLSSPSGLHAASLAVFQYVSSRSIPLDGGGGEWDVVVVQEGMHERDIDTSIRQVAGMLDTIGSTACFVDRSIQRSERHTWFAGTCAAGLAPISMIAMRILPSDDAWKELGCGAFSVASRQQACTDIENYAAKRSIPMMITMRADDIDGIYKACKGWHKSNAPARRALGR